MEIVNVAVLGAGWMGTGIAQVIAVAGYRVSVNDAYEEMLDKSKHTISKQLDRSVEKGSITKDAAKNALERIVFTRELKDAVEYADYVIEAVPENLELKKKVFHQVDELVKKSAIIASNTTQLSIASLAQATSREELVIGTHWFFPPTVMKLIEVVVTPATSPDTVTTTLDFCKRIGKETVVCKDAPGFITSRAIIALASECFRIYDEGVASFEDIDKAMRLAFNHPIGPFQMADMSGLDILVHAMEELNRAYGERFRVSPTMIQRVQEGRLGQKTGKGFYEYDAEKRKG